VLILVLLAIAGILAWIGVSLSSIVVNTAIAATEARELHRTAEALNERAEIIEDRLDDIRSQLVDTDHNAEVARLQDRFDSAEEREEAISMVFRPMPPPRQPGGWLHAPGGLALSVQYRRGNQTSANHLSTIGHVLRHMLGAEPIAGSLNLHSDEPLNLPQPAVRRLYGGVWQFSPVVLSESAIGVIARRSDTGPNAFMEVFAARHLVTELALVEGEFVSIRILSGVELLDAA
jgi:hypothetical protein